MRILVVDDDPDALRALAMLLERDHEVVARGSGTEAIAELRERPVDLVLTDLGMPPPDGFDVMRAAGELPAPPPIAVITALDSARAALEATRLGARDFLVKPASREDVLGVVSRIEEKLRGGGAAPVAGLVGRSPLLDRVRTMVPLLARCRETVLILGETGTGKELLARALHDLGPRSAGPFVAHNMAATPAELAESVFFGHVKGAFSGAAADHAGLFEQAAGGTLFLDEVDSFPFGLQAKLLRVLEGGRVQRVGSCVERTVDARVLAASSTDLGDLVAAGRFRADLYYRLRQLEASMPPLRDHLEDVPSLAGHFLAEIAASPGHELRLTGEAMNRLTRYSWPGNCRELRNAIRGAAVLAGAGPIEVGHLPAAVRCRAEGGAPADPPSTLLAAEREHIRQVLERAGGNRSLAARLLGIDRGTLARKLRAMDLEPPAR
jgi:DNA-binding NtrC family response regulator